MKFVIFFCFTISFSLQFIKCSRLNNFCQDGFGKVICSGLIIQENTTYNDVFDFSCTDGSEVIIINSHIPILHEGMLTRLSGIIHWSSPEVGLSRIDGPIYFNNAKTLRGLDLSHNKLQNVSGGVFKRLIGLESLDLSYNKLTELESGTFEGLENLIFLNLSGNEMKSLSENVFKELKYLLTLDFSENSISAYSEDIFSHNIHLTFLFFRRAFANELSLDILGNLKELERLDVSQNYLKYKVGSFAEMEKLESLNLSSSELTDNSIEYGQFTYNKKLKTLDLSSNEMMHFDTTILAFLSSLTELYLHNNKLYDSFDYLTLESNHNLDLISLSDNNWPCGFLTKMLKNFYHRKLTIHQPYGGLVRKSRNVEGIMCRY